jgi:hypothetical protein
MARRVEEISLIAIGRQQFLAELFQALFGTPIARLGVL